MREILPSESKQQSKIRDQSKSKFAPPAAQISELEEFRQKKGKVVSEPSEDDIDDSTFAMPQEHYRSVEDLEEITKDSHKIYDNLE